MALTHSNEHARYSPVGVLSHQEGDGRLAHRVYECPVCALLTRSPDLHFEQSGHKAATTDAPSGPSDSASGPGATSGSPDHASQDRPPRP